MVVPAGWAPARAEGKDLHQALSKDANNSQVDPIGGHLLTTLQWKALLGCCLMADGL